MADNYNELWQPNGVGNLAMGNMPITHKVMLGYTIPESHPWHTVHTTKGKVHAKRITAERMMELWELFK